MNDLAETIAGAIWALAAYNYAIENEVRMFQNGRDNVNAFECTSVGGNHVYWLPGWVSKWPRELPEKEE